MIPRKLSPRRHAVFRLAPDLLLVFKPSGHHEPAHTHEHGQRLRVLRGALRIRLSGRWIILRAGRGSLGIAAGRSHETFAAVDTWLVAEIRPVRK
jgi:quercetin dioxygenase-like cupin family protein